MRRWNCSCGNPLFFDAVNCVQCGGQTAMCPSCRGLVLLVANDDERYQCSNPDCRAELRLCDNYRAHAVCNRAVLRDGDQARFCDYCGYNQLIPDLAVEGNLQKWQKLEAAKRRALHGLEAAGFSLANLEHDGTPTLRFEFKDGATPTGHADGRITINLREADDVEREKARVKFGEPQRSLIGHFRHELGHYFWDRIVKPVRLTEFRKLFGNEEEPSYDQARQQYYDAGPAKDWSHQFVSAYASMHPWEDFAETFGVYLDMRAVLDTSEHFQVATSNSNAFDDMVERYHQIGIYVNELNRDIGLADLVPEVFTSAIVEKMQFVHELREVPDDEIRARG